MFFKTARFCNTITLGKWSRVLNKASNAPKSYWITVEFFVLALPRLCSRLLLEWDPHPWIFHSICRQIRRKKMRLRNDTRYFEDRRSIGKKDSIFDDSIPWDATSTTVIRWGLLPGFEQIVYLLHPPRENCDAFKWVDTQDNSQEDIQNDKTEISWIWKTPRNRSFFDLLIWFTPVRRSVA